jgi:hypothetical protein
VRVISPRRSQIRVVPATRPASCTKVDERANGRVSTATVWPAHRA